MHFLIFGGPAFQKVIWVIVYYTNYSKINFTKKEQTYSTA